MKNYQKSKLYAIRSFLTLDVYYGSTTRSLATRLSEHKSNYKAWKEDEYHYVTSFDIVKYDDCYIELVEVFPCDSKEELLKREGELIRSKNDAVNKYVAGRTTVQYRLDNKDSIAIKHKKQYQDNKEVILMKANVKHICKYCGGKYTQGHKSRHLKSKKHIANLV